MNIPVSFDAAPFRVLEAICQTQTAGYLAGAGINLGSSIDMELT
jgi:hypothetical protein